MINILLFSKNRAAQLDLALCSIKQKFKVESKIRVMYTTTSDEYEKGYDIVKKSYPEVEFIKDTVFKDTLVQIISQYKEKHCLFFADDDVFIKDVEADEFAVMMDVFEGNDKIHALSLRMNKTVNFCNPANMKISAPKQFIEDKKYLLWAWGDGALNQFYCWGYPMAIDSHIYEAKRLVNLIKTLEFTNVNELESRLNGRRYFDKPLLLSFTETKVFNVQNNFVQGTRVAEVENGHSIEELNNLFLNGKKLGTGNLFGMSPTQAHGAVKYEIVDSADDPSSDDEDEVEKPITSNGVDPSTLPTADDTEKDDEGAEEANEEVESLEDAESTEENTTDTPENEAEVKSEDVSVSKTVNTTKKPEKASVKPKQTKTKNKK